MHKFNIVFLHLKLKACTNKLDQVNEMPVILILREPVFQNDRSDVLKPKWPCIGHALRLVGSNVLGTAAKRIWDGWTTWCHGCTNSLPYSRSNNEWIICAAQILEIMSPQLDQIRYEVLEDEVHEVEWKGPRELHRLDKAKDGHTFHPIFLGKSFSFCIASANWPMLCTGCTANYSWLQQGSQYYRPVQKTDKKTGL